MNYRDINKKRKDVLDYLRKNPKATYKQLKKEGFAHIERLFKNGLGEAYKKSGLVPPRTFKRKNKEEKRKIIIDYIKKHPMAGGHTIKKDTKINFQVLFKNLKEAFEMADTPYPREEQIKSRARSKPEKIKEVAAFLKETPEATFEDIKLQTGINPYKIFDSLKDAYKFIGIKEVNRHEKRKIRKQKIIIDFIKNNPLATQREINLNCKTKVQELFDKGIFEAYKKAGINFPFERLKLHGTALKDIRERAEGFEGEIAGKLTCYGNVNRLIKTKRGVADIILERKDKKAIIEVKDYLKKDISISQVRQLNKYLEDCGCNIGFLICHNPPNKDRFLMGKNRIIILDEKSLSRIPDIIDKGSWRNGIVSASRAEVSGSIPDEPI